MTTKNNPLPDIFNYETSVMPTQKAMPAIFSYENTQAPIEEYLPNKQSEKRSFLQNVAEDITESENIQKNIERNAARSTSRIAERMLGLPGDILGFVAGMTNEKPLLPSSADFQRISEKLTGGYTAPRNESEAALDEFIGDVGSFALPGGSNYSFARNLGIPLVANLAKEGIKYTGAADSTQAAVKNGTMFALDLLNPKKGLPSVGRYINSLFRDAEAAIPSGALADAKDLSSSLKDLKNLLRRGGKAASDVPALKKISELENRILNNQISAHELPAFRVKINEAISELGGFGVQLPKSVKRTAISKLGNVKDAVIKAGEKYGATNPEFLINWRNANEAAAVAHKSNYITNLIQKHFLTKFTSNAAKALFGLGVVPGAAYGGLKGATVGLGATAGLASLYEGTKILHRVIASPTLRKYYSNVITNASKNNIPSMMSNLSLLDKKLADEERKEQEKLNKLLK